MRITFACNAALVFSHAGGMSAQARKTTPPAKAAAQIGVPIIRLAITSASIENSPGRLSNPIRVGPRGLVLIEADRGSDHRLIVHSNKVRWPVLLRRVTARIRHFRMRVVLLCKTLADR